MFPCAETEVTSAFNKKSGDVKIVDRHIEENAPAVLDKCRRRRARVAGYPFKIKGRSDVSGLYSSPGFPISAVKSPHKTDLTNDVVLFDDPNRPVGFL